MSKTKEGSLEKKSDSRVDWYTYLHTLCLIVAQRSIDPDTKHGSLIVDEDYSILSTGYNGPPRNINDAELDMSRPAKYDIMVHSEENCIANAAKNGIRIKGCSLFVTGFPCKNCSNLIVNSGIKKVYVGKIKSKMCQEDSYEYTRKLFRMAQIELVENSLRDNQISSLLKSTNIYLTSKMVDYAE